MRDLEQAKAEIFQRSQMRIRKRKTLGKRIAACCIPVVLCAGIFSMSILPEFSAGESLVAESVSNGNSKEKDAVVHVSGEEYRISGEDADAIWSILKKLDYNPYRVCRCLPKCEVELHSHSYGLNFGEGYARCEEGQARLSQEQMYTIQQILNKYSIS